MRTQIPTSVARGVRVVMAGDGPLVGGGLLGAFDFTGQRVSSYVLAGHEACARVLNPAYTSTGRPVRWAHVRPGPFRHCSTTQWPQPRPEASELFGPSMGSPDRRMAAGLLACLDVSAFETVHVAQWKGYTGTTHPDTAQPVTFPPGRESAVWDTPAADLLRLDRIPMRWWHPTLEWTVGNDIYARSLFVSGPRTLIDTVLTSSGLEAYEVNFTDPVTAEDW